MSREKKWTPGPWEVDHACSLGHPDTLAIYHCPNPHIIIEVVESPDEHNGNCIHGNNENQRVANAALISAAPELVEALENFKGLFDNPIARRRFGSDKIFTETLMDMESAIAKAYGEIVE